MTRDDDVDDDNNNETVNMSKEVVKGIRFLRYVFFFKTTCRYY